MSNDYNETAKFQIANDKDNYKDKDKKTLFTRDKRNSTLEIIDSPDNLFNQNVHNQGNEIQKSKIRWVILMLICINSVIYNF